MPKYDEAYVARSKTHGLFLRFVSLPQSGFNLSPPKMKVETCVSADFATQLQCSVLRGNLINAEGIEALGEIELVPVFVETRVHIVKGECDAC